MRGAESSGSAADHNLDLSLGSSASKPNNLEVGNDDQNVGVDQSSSSMPYESDWRNRELRPKVDIFVLSFALLYLTIFYEVWFSFSYFSGVKCIAEFLLLIMGLQLNLHQEPGRRNGYNEAETTLLLSQTHIHSPGSMRAPTAHDELQIYGQMKRPGDHQAHNMLHLLPSHLGSSNYQVSVSDTYFFFFFG